VTINVESVNDGVTIVGSTRADTINATTTVAGQPLPTNEIDTIAGGKGKDTIDALDGNDVVDGGDGADKLTGGGGDDELTGGRGSDAFQFAAGFGNDTIFDFDPNRVGGQDFLDVSALGITSTNFATLVAIEPITFQGVDSTLVTIDDDDPDQTIPLVGVDRATVTQADVLLQ
jgi:Ca2+-binding RTX toxin-like protein